MAMVRKSLSEISVTSDDWKRAIQVQDDEIDLSEIPEMTESDFRSAQFKGASTEPKGSTQAQEKPSS
jgi:hypothetical protein